METNAERVKELVLSKLKAIADDYYASMMIEAFYVADYCLFTIRELLDDLDAKSEAPKEDKS
jgi:hypothetical protein